MARIRTVKPDLWGDEKLGKLPRDARLLFIGLLNFADDAGRLRGDPMLIRSQVFPYDEIDVAPLLADLCASGLLVPYQTNGEHFLWIRNFLKHQKLDHPSAPVFPSPPRTLTRASPKAQRGLTERSPQEGKGREKEGIREGIRERKGSGNGELQKIAQGTLAKSASVAPARPGVPVTGPTFDAYSAAYEIRYHAPPVRNAKVNAQLAQLVQRLGAEEAPDVAAFYVRHNGAFYSQKGHPVGLLLADAEKLRMEWATNRPITATSARLADQSQTNFQSWKEAVEEVERVVHR